jgi:hypothetical protein
MQIAAMATTDIADYFTPTAFMHRLLAGAGFMVAASATFNGPPSGPHAWVWLRDCRRLRARCERHTDIHEAFLQVACYLISWRTLKRSFF